MPLKEQQDFLARLYTDPHYAERFFDHPDSAVSDFGISVEEAAEIAASAGEEIRIFADSLIAKRLREVEKLLPISRSILSEAFVHLFRSHASSFNPVTAKKHLEDALEFGEYVERNTSNESLFRALIAFETAKLKHFATSRRFTVCSLQHDIRPILDGRVVDLAGQRRTLAIWLRIKEKQRFFFI